MIYSIISKMYRLEIFHNHNIRRTMVLNIPFIESLYLTGLYKPLRKLRLAALSDFSSLSMLSQKFRFMCSFN